LRSRERHCDSEVALSPGPRSADTAREAAAKKKKKKKKKN